MTSTRQLVLVVGSGGRTKYGFLRSLAAEGVTPVLFDPSSADFVFLPDGCCAEEVQFEIEGLAKAARRWGSKGEVIAVATIYEPCVELAAELREVLGLKGLRAADARLGRNKASMYSFLSSGGVRVPETTTFGFSNALGVVDKLMVGRRYILKPALGSANIGVRVVNDPSEFSSLFDEAQRDVVARSTVVWDCREGVDDWLLSEFIPGKEVEVDLVVVDGQIVFAAMQEKTLINLRGNIVEENNALIPPMTLTPDERRGVDSQCLRLANLIWSDVCTPGNLKAINLYVEFRVLDDGTAYCLEFAFRVGGCLVPEAVRRSTGCDLFHVAASIALDRDVNLSPSNSNRSVYWQVLYADRRGVFRGFRVPDCEDVVFLPLVSQGTSISTPQSEYLAYMLVEADSPQEATEIACRWLDEAVLLLENGDGELIEIPMPRPSGPTDSREVLESQAR
jgi:biotin carboxylase